MRFTISAILLLLNVYFKTAFAQQYSTILLIINPKIEQEKLQLHKSYTLRNNSSLSIEQLKFYISGVQLLKDAKVVWMEKNSFHLIDQENTSSETIRLNISKNTSYNKISFNLGIDSLTNVSGAFGGDLDPTKGMYWTWQSGYINFKMEGVSSLCDAKHNEFQLHLGGYQAPFNSLQQITLEIKDANPIAIELDISKIMETVRFKEEHHIMSPGDNAVRLSNEIANSFTIATP